MYSDEYTVFGNYINNKEHIKMKHKNCGHYFDIIPSKMFYNVNPCPYCKRPTKGEQKILNYLDNNIYDYTKEIQRFNWC